MTSSAIFGRAGEIAAIEAALDDARNRSGRLVLVVGEAGIGKTTLLAEIKRAAQDCAFSVALSRGFHVHDEAPPFWPWIQILGRLRSLGLLAEAHGRLLRTLDIDLDDGRVEISAQNRFQHRRGHRPGIGQSCKRASAVHRDR